MTLHTKKLAGLLVITTALLTACSVIPQQAPVTVYQLPLPIATASTPHATAQTALLPAIRVITPSASPTLNSDRILVSQSPNQLLAYQGVRWHDMAPRIVRNHLAQALKNNNRWQAVTTDDNNALASYQLGGELHAFQVFDNTGERKVVIRFDATVVNTESNRVMAARAFELTEAVTGQDFEAVVKTFGQATDRLGQQLAQWLTQTLAP